MITFRHITKLRDQRGSALVAVFILGLVLTITGLAFFSMGGHEAALYERRRESEQAFCRAESAVDRARWILVQTRSKSAALMDSAGMEVYEVNEIDAWGNVINEGTDQITLNDNVRIRTRGTDRQQQRELEVILEPALSYAVATGQHITFHGTSNNWSAADAMDDDNDVYIEGGLAYDHHINHPDEPWKYDWARPDVITEPAYMTNQNDFKNYFRPQADLVLNGNQSWGWNGSGWDELDPDASVVYVKGKVDINMNVWDNYLNESHDVTIIATNDITVTNGTNGDDDRLTLISLSNVNMEGDGTGGGFNGFLMAGNKVTSDGTGGGSHGGQGELRGMIYYCHHIDMKGYDSLEQYPEQHGWRITQRPETVLLNGGISVLPGLLSGNVITLRPTSWTETPPGA
jgi:hypothetical protein